MDPEQARQLVRAIACIEELYVTALGGRCSYERGLSRHPLWTGHLPMESGLAIGFLGDPGDPKELYTPWGTLDLFRAPDVYVNTRMFCAGLTLRKLSFGQYNTFGVIAVGDLQLPDPQPLYDTSRHRGYFVLAGEWQQYMQEPASR